MGLPLTRMVLSGLNPHRDNGPLLPIIAFRWESGPNDTRLIVGNTKRATPSRVALDRWESNPKSWSNLPLQWGPDLRPFALH